MRILVLSFYYTPDFSAGSFRTAALVEQLKASGAEVEVVTTMPNRYASLKSEALAYEVEDNISVYRFSLPPHKSGMRDQIVSFFSFYRQVLKHTENRQYDMVYATSSRLFTAFLGKRIAVKKEIPIYLDIRDIFLDTLGDIISPLTFKIIHPFLNQVERYTFNNCNHINLVSEGFRGYFERKFVCPSYSFFTNGIDNEFLGKNFANSKSNEDLNILYAGNLGEGQGLHNIVPGLASEYPNYKFTIIGDGGRKRDLVCACRGIDNVEILSPIKRCELNVRYKQADVLFLHLNDREAFKKVLPSKLFEYAATGKPILAGIAGYAAEFTSKEIANAAVFSPGNIKEACSQFERLSLNNTQRDEFVSKFKRSMIMEKLSDSILNVGKRK